VQSKAAAERLEQIHSLRPSQPHFRRRNMGIPWCSFTFGPRIQTRRS
jgi:hypothetical protein